MTELELILEDINEAKKRGKDRLYVEKFVNHEIILALRDKGFLALQFFNNGYVDTVVGWKND